MTDPSKFQAIETYAARGAMIGVLTMVFLNITTGVFPGGYIGGAIGGGLVNVALACAGIWLLAGMADPIGGRTKDSLPIQRTVLRCLPARAALSYVETRLTASDAAAEDYFGWSVAICGNTGIVGQTAMGIS